MDSKAIKDMFRTCETDENFKKYLSSEKKSAAIQALKSETARKTIVPRVSKLELIRNQLWFMDKRNMAFQLLCFLLVILLYTAFGQRLGSNDIFTVGAIVAALFSIFAALTFSRDEACGIREVAGACCFNNRQICVLQMVLHTSINMMILAGMILIIGSKADRSMYEVGIYILVPFLVTGCVLYAVLLSGAGKRGNAVLAAIGMFMAAVFAAMSSVREIYEQAAMGVWVTILVIGALLYITETVLLIRRVEKGETLCMN